MAAWQAPARETDLRRWILAHAILAPHSHNLQSWVADLGTPNQITLYCDLKRLLPQTDPLSRQIMMSHGTFLELLDLAMSLATHVEMRFKHGFACQRPVDLSPQIQPMIPTPGHASWPSGHATEAYLTCALLQSLLPHGGKYREQLERLAARIAVNRTVAGLHYPVDSAVGRLLGTALADFMVARCTAAKLHERGFDGRKFHDAKGHVIDFDPRVSMADNHSGYYELMAGSHAVAASPLLNFMWTKAAAEWAPLQ
mgnify:CR=1 FL=1